MKKTVSIIVIALILIALVVLSNNNTADEVVTTSGERVTTGIVEPTPPPAAIPPTSPVTAPSPIPTPPPPADQAQETAPPSPIPPVPTPPVGIAVGNKAPNFILEAFDGSVVELDEIDTSVVIDFWAGWCPFCVAELPDLEAAHQELGDEITFLGIHRTNTESVDKGQDFANDRGVTYTLLKDSDGSVYRTYTGGQSFMPVAFYIDEHGVIKDRVFGPKDKQSLDESISTLR